MILGIQKPVSNLREVKLILSFQEQLMSIKIEWSISIDSAAAGFDIYPADR